MGSAVKIDIHNGDVTVSGTILYEHQRQAVLTTARGVEGVRRVVDQLQVKPKGGAWKKAE
jgi:osmotically-inducible protein OsmY